MHPLLAVPPVLRHSREAAEFFAVVRHVLDVARAQNVATRPAFEWLRWADDLEIVVHSDFRQLVEMLAWQGTVVAPLPLTGDGSPTSSTPRTVLRTTRNKSGALDAVIQLARSRAVDPNDPQSGWASLVKIAEAPDRPAPLLGYAEGEGVLYLDTKDPCKVLTRTEFGKRFRRILKNFPDA
jgi:hypothetical protein